MDSTYDSLYYHHGELIAGIDEAGVSDIAGPLVAACVILPKIDRHKNDLRIFEVNDSKQVPERVRKRHAEVIWQTAIGIGIGEVQPAEVDYLGRQVSSSLAMLRAIAACRSTARSKILTPDFLIIDGDRRVQTQIPQKAVRDADTKSMCVAAASIVAKVYRDEIMIRLHERFPHYDWISNKGYPCENHFRGIDTHGVEIGIHRIKFWPFIRTPGFSENREEWNSRRYKWRQVTERKLGAELGDRVWSIETLSSKP